MSGKKRKRPFHFLRRKFPLKMQKKLVLLFMLIVLAFVGLVGRITYINASSGEKYTKVVLDQQQYDSRVIPFKRGDILDRNGTKVATSERVYNVILDAKVLLETKKNVEPTKEVLKECFGIEESVVDAVLEDNPGGRYNILLKGVSYEQAQAFKAIDEDDEKYPNVSGVWLEDDYIRKYPYNTLASAAIGFTVSGNVGNSGMEASYNSILNGTDGREYGYLDKNSSVERTVKQPVNGQTIVSTIDVNLQKIVEDHIWAFNEAHKNEVREGEGSKNTAVLVMKPGTGEILAMASYPNYDLSNPRDLTKYYTQEQIDGMDDDQKVEALNALWRNYCVTDTFEPGSTAKPFTVAAGLDSGKITGDETYVCGGYLHIGDYNIKCHNTSGHGTQTVGQAIANSCNVALMQIGEAIGVQDFTRYQNIFGFGQFTGIDLKGEPDTSGLLYNADNMQITDLATNAFGQNFNTTMVQLASGFNSLINGGNYYKPHIVKQIQDENGNVIENKDPQLIKKTISEETSTKVKEYMKMVVTEGTGTGTQVEGYDIGGKTGTAEKLPRKNGNYVLSFIGYAPQENPEVAVYVVIDEPNVENQSVSSYVTELSQQIMADIFPYLNITRVPGAEDPVPQEEPADEEDSEDTQLEDTDTNDTDDSDAEDPESDDTDTDNSDTEE